MEETTLEHIDPVKGYLVSGLKNSLNEVLAPLSYNSRKNNRFVPYRVCEHPAPTLFGDFAEFLIDGEWVVCEFGGPDWWEESNKIGNAQVGGGRSNTKKQKEMRKRNLSKGFSLGGKRNSPKQKEMRKRNSSLMSSHPNTKVGIREGGKTTSSQKWMSTEDGFVGSPGSVAIHNRSIGAPTDARIRLE